MKQLNEIERLQKGGILPPKNDVVFKTLFSRGKENITKALLEDILKIKIHKLELDKSKDLLNDNKRDKNGRLDLRALINDNVECDIELQLSSHDKMLERFLYYWAKIYTANLEIGHEYSNLRKTICIIIVDDEISSFKEILKSHTKWQIREEEYFKKILTPFLQIDIIELPKAIREYEKNSNNEVLQWMMFLNNPENKEVVRIMEVNEDIKEAKEELDKISQDDLLRRRALKAQIDEMDEKQRLYDAKRDGELKGRLEGIKQTAKKMLKKNIPIEIIIEITGLTKEQIESENL